MDAINIVSALVTLASFIFALVVYIRNKSLKNNIEAGLLSLIGTLDKISAMEEEDKYEKLHMGVSAAVARDHAIALLKSFSDKEERLRTYNFGIPDEDIQERIRKRKEALGIGIRGCIVENQSISCGSTSVDVSEIKVGDNISGFNRSSNSIEDEIVTGVERKLGESYILVNEKLRVTGRHLVWCRERGWVPAMELSIGDELLCERLEWDVVRSISLKEETATIFEVSTSSKNLFVSGYLVHNAKK